MHVLAATVFTVCLVVWRDLSFGDWSVVSLNAASVTILAVILSAIRSVSHRCIGFWFRTAVVCLSALLPAAYGLWHWINAQRPGPLWLPAALLLFGFLVIGVGTRIKKIPFHPVSFALVGIAFFLMHFFTHTMQAVRPGTWWLHGLLFLGSWAVTLSLGIVLSRIVGAFRNNLELSPFSMVALLVFGLLLLELDRRQLVGLYPAVHAWLLFGGVLAVESAVACWLHQRHFSTFGAVWGGALCAFVFWGGANVQSLSDAGTRAVLLQTPVGTHLVRWVEVDPQTLETNPVTGRDDVPQHFDGPALDPPVNVMLITVDALRSDALHYAPNLQKFAANSASFTRAYAQGTRTAIGMGTLMWGRYSPGISWDLWAYVDGEIKKRQEITPELKTQLSDRLVYTTLPAPTASGTLAQRLKRAGFHTIATPYAGSNDFFRAGLGFDAGFDDFADLTEVNWLNPTSDQLIEHALNQLDKRGDGKWFHWIHFYDPHESHGDRGAYNRLVGQFDAAFGQLLNQLKERKIFDNTLIVLTSDHGEAFGEHRHIGHGTSLYEEQIKVPLIVRIPGQAPAVFDNPVALVDVAATICVAVGASTEELEGVNLMPLIAGGDYSSERVIYSDLHRYLSPDAARTHDLSAAIIGFDKLIFDWQNGAAALYELKVDPGETTNMVSRRPETFRNLKALLGARRR